MFPHTARAVTGADWSFVSVSALDKLGRQPTFPALQTEPVTPAAIFDIAALILFGCQAVPIRLKILLDRLFAKLSDDDVAQILRAFGWSREEYVQGYIKVSESQSRSLSRSRSRSGSQGLCRSPHHATPGWPISVGSEGDASSRGQTSQRRRFRELQHADNDPSRLVQLSASHRPDRGVTSR